MIDLKSLFQWMVDKKASDLHIRSGKPAVLRVDGDLVARTQEPIPALTVEAWVKSFMNDKQQRIFEERFECDLALSVEGLGRFRVNVFRQRSVVNIAIRVIPNRIPPFEELKLPPSIKKIAESHRGLVLVTGTTGSGKSTTLASMIDYINSTRSKHIITIEDPLEYLHEDKLSIMSQRELGEDTLSYAEAVRHAMRQDPDVVLMGEIRDLETMSAALTVAQTGHLVLSTLHTTDATQTINRIIDIFPPHQQNQIRYQLADSLQGVISQRLLQKASGKGRIPAVEVMVVTQLVQKHIIENTTGEVKNVMTQGAYYGMQTFHQSLVSLLKAGEITLQTALEASANPEEIMMSVRGVESGTDSGAGFYTPQ